MIIQGVLQKWRHVNSRPDEWAASSHKRCWLEGNSYSSARLCCSCFVLDSKLLFIIARKMRWKKKTSLSVWRGVVFVAVSPVCCRCWAVWVCQCSAAVQSCCRSPAHRWRLVRSVTGWGTGGSCTGSPTGSGSLDWDPPSNAAAHTASPAGGTVTPLFSAQQQYQDIWWIVYDTLYVVVSRYECVY